VVLYGCETWYPTLWNEYRLRVYENRLLRRIFGPKRDEMGGGCGKLHDEKLRYLHSSPNVSKIIKSKRMIWAGTEARIGKKDAYSLFVGKPQGKGPLGRPRRRWVDNVRMELGEVGLGGIDWIDLAQNRNKWRALVNAVMNSWFHKILVNYRVFTQLVALASIKRMNTLTSTC
jgi:hypothetical protein